MHQQITQRTGTAVYFCDAHSPWQRGSNENANGLLRDYFPKRTDLHAVTAQDLHRVANQLNTRPRKTLGWATPAILLTAALRPSDLTDQDPYRGWLSPQDRDRVVV